MTVPLALLLLAASPPEVYRVSPLADGAVLAGSAVTYAVPTIVAPHVVSERCPCDTSGIPAFDRNALDNHSDGAAKASDVTLALAMALPPALDALALGWSPALRQDYVVYAETLAVAGALAQVTKVSVQRPRPRTYAGEGGYVDSRDGYTSFYSGHATLTFAALAATSMTARYRYGERWWPWLVTAAAGASVSAERVLAGKHFPSDVAVGALVGLGVGIAVPVLHHRDSPAVTLVPNALAPGVALSFAN